MNMLVRLGDHPRFIRATPHQADQVARFGGGDVIPDESEPITGQARLELVIDQTCADLAAAHRAARYRAEVRLIGRATCPDVYRFIGESR